jgi:hypothetical protein
VQQHAAPLWEQRHAPSFFASTFSFQRERRAPVYRPSLADPLWERQHAALSIDYRDVNGMIAVSFHLDDFEVWLLGFDAEESRVNKFYTSGLAY